MAKLLLLFLMGMVVMLSQGHASVLSPDPNSALDEEHVFMLADDYWSDSFDPADADDMVDDSVDEIDDDNAIEEQLTDEETDVGQHIEFPVEDMNEEELELYMNLEDQLLLGETDEHVGFKILKEKRSMNTKGGKPLRRKRVVPLIARAAFSVGRYVFRRFARNGITRSGSRVTRHYNGRGGYGDAVRDFNRLRPNNVQNFNGRISGRTGTMGNHRVTVRDGSSGNSRPTLEVRSHGGDMVRKFRYND